MPYMRNKQFYSQDVTQQSRFEFRPFHTRSTMPLSKVEEFKVSRQSAKNGLP